MNSVLSTRRYKAGYEIRTELIDRPELGGEAFEMKSAYTPSGDYIGGPERGYRLCKKRGIRPEKASPSDNVCSIGFSERDQKWYGWSHRAIYGFEIGSVAKEGDCVTTSGSIDEHLVDHPEADLTVPIGFEARTLGDAKRMAIAFADSVG